MVSGVSLHERFWSNFHCLLPQTSESDQIVDMGYCTTLRIYNVHQEYNNLFYKILINKRVIKITYGTTSMPFYMILHNLIIQSQSSIQYTV